MKSTKYFKVVIRRMPIRVTIDSLSFHINYDFFHNFKLGNKQILKIKSNYAASFQTAVYLILLFSGANLGQHFTE